MKKLLILLFWVVSSPLMAAQPVQVVASIRPLQLIADALLVEVGQSQVLLPAGSSPHHFSLKPSQLRLIRDADLVIWVGPQMETFLQRPLALSHTRQLVWQPGTELDQHEHTHDHAHDHDSITEDPHLWLDPHQALLFAERLRQLLEQLRPESAEQLQRNYQAFVSEVEETDRDNRVLLAPVREKGFVVFHDAFSRLVAHYQLNQVAYFTLEPGMPPGARKVAEIRRVLARGDVQCLFTEPQFDPEIMRRTNADLNVAEGRLDPLASGLPAGAGYPQFLRRLVVSIHACLANNKE